jgi:phosphoglycerate dehydrogenase-like enzyme
LAQLQASLWPKVELTHGPEIPVPAGYQILIAGRPSREQLGASPNLCALIILWAGVPEATRDLMREFPHVSVHNLHHNAVPVAELALALMLAAAKSIIPNDRALHVHDWRPRYQRDPTLLLAGKTALILGYGAVGRQVARLCRGMGMKVIATRRTAGSSDDGPDEIHPPAALKGLLPRAQVLFICLPHTAETDRLIGAAELALLAPGAILVNVGRGSIVHEEALFRALGDGTLFAAGLDVWYKYPADQEARSPHPSLSLPFSRVGERGDEPPPSGPL